MNESYINHPLCNNKCDEKTYLGVYRYIEELFQIWQCVKCNHYYKRSKLDDKNDIHIELDEAKELLEDRISCPLCKKYEVEKIKAKRNNILKDNHKGFMCKYVIAKGNSYRFYCRNHPLKKHNRYEFNNSSEYTKMTLRAFFESIKIYNKVEKHKLDEISVLIFLLTINMPKTIIANILNKSRPTIDKMIRSNISTQETEYRYKKIINISNTRSKNIFETVINIPLETLDDAEHYVKIREKKVLFNP